MISKSADARRGASRGRAPRCSSRHRHRPSSSRLGALAAGGRHLSHGRQDHRRQDHAEVVGNRRLIETAVATLATDRALLLLGVPGTAKSWVSEHLAAAITALRSWLIQCTAGTDENQIRYGWNYAQLLAKGRRARPWWRRR